VPHPQPNLPLVLGSLPKRLVFDEPYDEGNGVTRLGKTPDCEAQVTLPGLPKPEQ
jgi:hypothetical protein